MELKWLEDFVAVAKLRNFSHAARARHATQPALSRRVRSLENWYGVSLLDRSTYPVYNITSTPINPQAKIIITTRPTPLQAKAFALLGLDPSCSQ